MLACIACSSKEGGEDGSRAAATTPHHGKEAAVKSLTSQVRTTSISSEIPMYCTYIFFIERISISLYVHATVTATLYVRIITLFKGSLATP